MTPIDEICARLDELGIAWWQRKCHTCWKVEKEQGTELWRAWPAPDGTVTLKVDAIYGLTPEQAIAATVGMGTCTYVPDEAGFTWWDENNVEHYEEYSASDECGSASCDKCGYSMMVGEEGWFDGWDEITEWWEEDGSYHKGYVLKPRFKHCPNCGRRVIKEDEGRSDGLG